jgi:hypothetical protein
MATEKKYIIGQSVIPQLLSLDGDLMEPWVLAT